MLSRLSRQPVYACGGRGLTQNNRAIWRDDSMEREMSAEQNEAVVRTMIRDGMERGDIVAAMAAYDSGFVYHNPVLQDMPGLPAGKEAMRILMTGCKTAFPDMTFSIDWLVADDDRVALHYTWHATHTEDFAGFPATGKPVSATGAIFCRLEHGRIVEQWDIDDRLAVMKQLGVPGEALTS